MLKTLPIIAMLAYVEASGTCDINSTVVGAGYPLEKYDLVTEDEYILEVARIPHGKNQTQGQRPVVFLMHGLYGSAYNFIALGSEYAMALNLADAGFDVWLGNARGVCNSRRHVKLNPDRQKVEFFNYSWEEIALYDIPVMLDFALSKSGQEKLHYIGHSQGGTTFLVLNSRKTEYNDKIISAHLLAGVGYQKNFSNKSLRRYSAFTNVFYRFLKTIRVVEIKYEWVGTEDTRKPEEGEKRVSLNELGTTASLKQVAHFGQNIKDKKFRSWDYSALGNLFKYGTVSPPEYDLTKINVDITMHYTLGDMLLNEGDVLAMVKDLPNARSRKVAKDDFTHYDFIQSSFVKPLVTDYIIKELTDRYAF